MLQLLYVSSAVAPMETDDLLALLEQCRQGNAQRGITGVLLYRDGAFMQVLEGEEEAVRQLYACIQADARHQDVTTLWQGAAAKRGFSDWRMSFHSLSGQRDTPDLAAFADPASLAERLPNRAGFAQQAARRFMQTNPRYPDAHASVG